MVRPLDPLRRLVLKNVVSITGRLALLLVAVVVLWSMRYRFDHIVVDNETYLVRVHRMTGDADVLIPGEGWVPAEDAWSDSSETPPTSASKGPGRRTPRPRMSAAGT